MSSGSSRHLFASIKVCRCQQTDTGFDDPASIEQQRWRANYAILIHVLIVRTIIVWELVRHMLRKQHPARMVIFVVVTICILLLSYIHAPIIQDPSYNRFADQRLILGVQNFDDVISNAPFLFIGWIGLAFVMRWKPSDSPQSFEESSERWAYIILFCGIALTSFGSSYYHLAPSDDRLVWDRLPMTAIFTSLYAATVSERIDKRVGRILLIPYVLTGLGSVIYWHLTELQGSGDLRLYMDIQYYSIFGIILMVLLFPSRYSHGRWLVAVLLAYLAAKGFEQLDLTLYQATNGIVSGHVIKHLISAVAAIFALHMIRERHALME